MKKLCVMFLCFAGFVGLQAQNTTLPPFTLSALVAADDTTQVLMLSALLQDKNFSDSDVACVLGLDEKTVSEARAHVGPLELYNLLALIEENYDKKCWKQFKSGVITPVLWVSTLIACECAFFYGGYLFFENIELKRKLQAATR